MVVPSVQLREPGDLISAKIARLDETYRLAAEFYVRQQRALKITGYNCTIEYLSGKENIYADLLSRIPNQLEQESELQETEIDDKYYQINVINSHRLHHRQGLGDLGTLKEMPKSKMLRLG